jgi:guanylate kinase
LLVADEKGEEPGCPYWAHPGSFNIMIAKIFYLMGKSACGKDTVYQHLLGSNPFGLMPLLLHTTRPMREGEQNGVQYYFDTVSQLDAYRKNGKIIEERVYHTTAGDWYYYTADDGQVDGHSCYLTIGTLESFQNLKRYFGDGCVIPIYLEVENGMRLERALSRERVQPNPRYAELCRRYLADEADFSEENLKRAGITKRFLNMDLKQTQEEILSYIGACLFAS